MNAGSGSRAGGFTIIELMVVVAVLAILATLTAPSFSSIIALQRVKTGASDLYIALTIARSEAVKRNANVTITPNVAGWEAGWTITDALANVLESHGPISGVTIGTVPASIVYQSSGRISGAVAPNLTVTSAAISTTKRCVTSGLSGRPAVQPC